MPANLIPGDRESRVMQSIFGGQDFLRWHHPAYTAGQSAFDPCGGNENAAIGLVKGGRVIDTTSLPNGTYFAAFPSTGMASITTHLKATIAGGTVTSTIFTTYADHATSYNAFTGTGALVTNTEQVATLSAPLGEKWAIVQLVVTGGTATLTWARAEYNGQKL